MTTLKHIAVAYALRCAHPAFYGSVELAHEAVKDWATPEEVRACHTDDDFKRVAEAVNLRTVGVGRPSCPV